MEQEGKYIFPWLRKRCKSTSQKEDQKMFKKFSAMVKDEKGQALAEYGLILALIAVICIIALQTLGGGVNNALTAIANAVTGA